jgi:hypothetical protein
MLARRSILPRHKVSPLERLLTTPVHGLERHEELMRRLHDDRDAIKVYLELSTNGRRT